MYEAGAGGGGESGCRAAGVESTSYVYELAIPLVAAAAAGNLTLTAMQAHLHIPEIPVKGRLRQDI